MTEIQRIRQHDILEAAFLRAGIDLEKLKYDSRDTFTFEGKTYHIVKEATGKLGECVVSERIVPDTISELRGKKTAHADDAGRLYLPQAGIDYAKTLPYNITGNTIKRLRASFQLFLKPQLLTEGTEHLRAAGLDEYVLPFLLQKEYIRKNGEHYVFDDGEAFIRDWATAFNAAGRPNLRRAYLRPRQGPLDGHFIERLTSSKNIWIGGEWAAEQYGSLLVPKDGLLYSKRPLKDLVQTFDLTLADAPSEEGRLLLMADFWDSTAYETQSPYVHPALAYADLIDSGEARAFQESQKVLNYALDQLRIRSFAESGRT